MLWAPGQCGKSSDLCRETTDRQQRDNRETTGGPEGEANFCCFHVVSLLFLFAQSLPRIRRTSRRSFLESVQPACGLNALAAFSCSASRWRAAVDAAVSSYINCACLAGPRRS